MTCPVSILCITYNQEKYIADAIESFLMQKTNFPFQIIISDDHSTDNTVLIVKQYERVHRNIKLIQRPVNLGVFNNFCRAAELIQSKYVALCEGDDYWTDDGKLQKQYDYMEQHSDVTVCFHPVYFVKNNEIQGIFPNDYIHDYDMTLQSLIKHNFIQTNSVMYRWIFEKIQGELNEPLLPLDHVVHLLHAENGKISMLDDVMSVYRINENGIWTGTLSWSSKWWKMHCDEIYAYYKLLNTRYGQTIGVNGIIAVLLLKYKMTIKVGVPRVLLMPGYYLKFKVVCKTCKLLFQILRVFSTGVERKKCKAYKEAFRIVYKLINNQ